MPLADARAWEPLLLGGLLLLVGLLPTVRHARGSDLHKLEPTLRVDFHFLVVKITIRSTAVTRFRRKGRVGTASLMRLM